MRPHRIAYGAHVASQAYSGTGNGTMTGLATRAAAVSEVWMIKLITAAANGGTFSVTGSLSGRKADATVGAAYDNGQIAFTINDGSVDFAVGDTFTVTVTRQSSITFPWSGSPWVPATEAVGSGREESAAGTPSGWVTRWENSLEVELRFEEALWVSVLALLQAVMPGTTFDWYPDSALDTYHTCYLVDPRPAGGQAVRPARGEYFGELRLPIRFRRTDGAVIPPVFFV
jgi:hypothetical protein